jgi:hypothetical protein
MRRVRDEGQEETQTYQSSDGHAGYDGGDGSGAHEAGYAAACGDGAESECDLVEGLGHGQWGAF